MFATTADIFYLLALLLGGGALAGWLAGLLGVGGGVIMVPLLFQLLVIIGAAEAVQMHLAIGTSLAIIIFTGARALAAQAKRNAVDWDVLRAFALPVMGGSLVGALLARYISADGLKLIFAIGLLLVAAKLLFAPRWGTEGGARLSARAQRVWASAIGFVSAWLGIGGGLFSVILLRMGGHTIHRAVAASSGIGVFIALAGASGFLIAGYGRTDLPPFSLGYLYLPGLVMAAASTIAAPLGVRTSHAFPPRTLELIFTAFLLAAATRMLWALA